MKIETTKGIDSPDIAQGVAVMDIEAVEPLPGNNISGKNPQVVQNSVRNSVDLSGPKRGHSFCGCCCDVRRATIAINFVLITFTIITIILVIAAISSAQSNDDDIYKGLDSAFTTAIVITILSIFFSIAAVIGAINFNPWLVLSNAIWLVVGFISSTTVNVKASNDDPDYNYGIGTVILNLIVTSFFIYPHAMLFYELKISKTMTKPTYPREEQSCCCVDPRPPGY